MKWWLIFLIVLSIGCKTQPRKAVIILKMDDLEYKDAQFVQNWERYIDTVKSYNINSSLGIIIDNLIDSPQSYKDSLISWHTSDDFEIWHHGWDHQKQNFPPDSANLGEFQGTPYIYQKDHLDTGIKVVKQELGISMKSFGAPYNKTDTVFTKVITENSDLKVWLYCDDATYTGLCLTRGELNKLESKTGVVSFESFLKGYKANKNSYLVLQGHPGKWNDQSFLAFENVIRFLKSKGHSFTLPYKYYESHSS